MQDYLALSFQLNEWPRIDGQDVAASRWSPLFELFEDCLLLVFDLENHIEKK